MSSARFLSCTMYAPRTIFAAQMYLLGVSQAPSLNSLEAKSGGKCDVPALTSALQV
jgi:hypothetical protein